MYTTRRGALIGLGAMAIAGPARAATASRTFRIFRGDSDIGRHRLDARREGDGTIAVTIDIDIAVKVFGLTAYRYTLENTERWQAGRLVSVASRIDDDGTASLVRVARDGDLLRIDATGYSGTAPGDAVTTSYFARGLVERRPWISTQSGVPLKISATEAGGGRFRIGGDLEITLGYDGAGEWTGCSFEAKGEEVRYKLTDASGAIAGLWAG